MTVLPYQDEKLSKKKQVAKMFDNISHRYDFLNHLLSLGIDIIWRKKAIGLLKNAKPKTILDIATGTGDFAIAALKLNPDKVIGVDISKGMLEKGKEKLRKRNLDGKIDLQLGDSEKLLFEADSFDAVIVAFGVRNFENLKQGLTDMYRVLKPGGSTVILEFSKPQKFPLKQIFNFYFRSILPLLGRMISSDKGAYTYLPESVQAFPEGIEFLGILKDVGFKEARLKRLTFGISSIYIAYK